MQDAILKWLAVVGLYTLCRLWFFLANWTGFRTDAWAEVGEAFAQGLRFDVSILAILHAPLLFAWLVMPLRFWQRHVAACRRFTTAYLVIVNVPFLWLSMGDVFYYKFTGRRFNASLFRIAQDVRDQAAGIMAQYWYVTLAGFVLAYLFYRLMARPWRAMPREAAAAGRRPLRQGAIVLLGTFILFVAIRGGWQLRPLSIAHAYEFGDASLGQLALNTPFSILKSSADKIPSRRHDFASDAAWRQLLDYQPSPPHATMKGDNVVLIIVESLGAEYMRQPSGAGVTYTPFLDGLAAQGLSFHHHYANGRRSIDAVPSIVAGIPSLMEEPFITSPFQGNEVWGLPRLLARVGYQTSFYHGGNNGTMHFDVFAHVAGFQRYVGRNEYPEPQRDYDGQWGIWDEPFLSFMADDLNREKSPFFSTVFTLTSHNPFVVPDRYLGKLPEGSLPIHKTIAYIDKALQAFFAKAATMPWYQHTLFVITGDHTSLTSIEDYANERGRYRVPLIFYHPGKELPVADLEKPVQHVDILPSVLDLLGVVPPRRTLFNGSAFDAAYPGRAYNRLGESWWLLTPTDFARGKPGEAPSVFAVADDFARHPLGDPARIAAMKSLMDAYATYFVNGLLDNNWYEDAKKTVVP